MIRHSHVLQYLGKHIQCHTHFGMFQGIVVHCTKHYVILGRLPMRQDGELAEASFFPRQYPMGGGQMGPGGGPGWGGGGWHIAVPLAAILGITAVGMHWW